MAPEPTRPGGPISAGDEGGSWASFFGGGLLLAVIAVVLANTNVAEGENGGTREMIGTLIFLAVIAAALYFLLRARTGSSAPVGLLLGIVAVVAIGIYWSGLPFLLGGAAVAVGRRAADQGKLPLVAQILGAVGVLGGVVALITDKL